jgi:GTP-binding protein LepA
MSNIRNFCIIAHIDHGKSTLADRFLEFTKTVETRNMKDQLLDTMDLERERGITIKLQPVRMIYYPQITNTNNQTDELKIKNLKLKIDSEYILNLIDTPGHVDFSYEVSRSLAAVQGAILLVDATQGVQAQTLANLYQAMDQNLTIIPVLNKIDLPNADVEKSKKELVDLLGFHEDEILAVSAKTGEGVEKVFEEIVKKVPPPIGNIDAPTQALVFDSIYDNYRGVVAYVSVVNGRITKNDKIKLLATGAQDEALEVGTFSPKLMPKEELFAGEIGYIVTGLKDVSQCQVGETVTVTQSSKLKTQNDSNILVNALPGYKKVVPMVFASIYTTDGEINKLRDALGKLKLNDASLGYEPENSSAFGFGFKCGFLGLLHMEIIKERLEREYNLSLIVTTPKVNYIKYTVNGRDEYEEPWCKVEIISPQVYIGAIMELLDNNRGLYKEMRYLGDRVILDYECPLAQIIVNFYDQLKSASQGYASMNYELIDYRKEDLVLMDVLVAGEKIDVLEQVVHRLELNNRAHEIVKKLKSLIPRQWFDVTIQAAIGGKILARENIAAFKKDVAGYLYGGDISRRKKLWAKQARGKKKMKKLGRVDIPTDVFINLLKK